MDDEIVSVNGALFRQLRHSEAVVNLKTPLQLDMVIRRRVKGRCSNSVSFEANGLFHYFLGLTYNGNDPHFAKYMHLNNPFIKFFHLYSVLNRSHSRA